jgi:hypothetical protein
MALPVVLETLPLDGVVASSLIPSRCLRKSPVCCFPRTNLRYPSLRTLSRLPLQRWRGPYQLGLGAFIKLLFDHVTVSRVLALSIVYRRSSCHMLGASGVISLVQERSTGRLYAMMMQVSSSQRCITSHMSAQDGYVEESQEGQVRAECDSFVRFSGGAEWIVRLHYNFQDRDNLYLVRPRSSCGLSLALYLTGH